MIITSVVVSSSASLEMADVRDIGDWRYPELGGDDRA